jgi:imidazolonepropionase-like amidohydrolase
MRRTFANAYPRQLQLAKILADAGVRMMTGSDGGWLSGPGLTLQEEFVQLAMAGLSPLRVLQMTTINAAEYLGRTSTMGTVEPGRNADLVLLDANPLERVEHLGLIAGVVRAGFHYSREDLNRLRDRVALGRGYLS